VVLLTEKRSEYKLDLLNGYFDRRQNSTQVSKFSYTKSNTQTLERFKSKALRTIIDAPWHVPNTDIRMDFQTPTAKEETRH
jgi:hypothetical protein